jgi:hypothetical protein
MTRPRSTTAPLSSDQNAHNPQNGGLCVPASQSSEVSETPLGTWDATFRNCPGNVPIRAQIMFTNGARQPLPACAWVMFVIFRFRHKWASSRARTRWTTVPNKCFAWFTLLASFQAESSSPCPRLRTEEVQVLSFMRRPSDTSLPMTKDLIAASHWAE